MPVCSTSWFGSKQVDKGYTVNDSSHRYNNLPPCDVNDKAQVQLSLKFGCINIPHPHKVEYGGEDAWFTSKSAFGVADGVGGCALNGVNPAAYAREFMNHTCDYLHHAGAFEDSSFRTKLAKGQDCEVRAALHAAHTTTKQPGACTALVLSLDPVHSILTAANMGDSGFILVRNGRIIGRSRPMQHEFGLPYQFSAALSLNSATDEARSAEVYEHELEVGDIIVAATDGLWDNMHEKDIVNMLGQIEESGVKNTALRIARTARLHAADESYDSPFAQAFNSYNKMLNRGCCGWFSMTHRFSGGKMDDITVIMAVVQYELNDTNNRTCGQPTRRQADIMCTSSMPLTSASASPSTSLPNSSHGLEEGIIIWSNDLVSPMPPPPPSKDDADAPQQAAGTPPSMQNHECAGAGDGTAVQEQDVVVQENLMSLDRAPSLHVYSSRTTLCPGGSSALI